MFGNNLAMGFVCPPGDFDSIHVTSVTPISDGIAMETVLCDIMHGGKRLGDIGTFLPLNPRTHTAGR